MVPCREQCYTSGRRMSPKARIFFLRAVLFILVSVLQVPSATSTSLKGQRAVFDHNRNNEYGTLSAETRIPSLEEFTLCVDIRIRGNIKNGMAVFTYNIDSSPPGRPSRHELGIIVKKNHLEILMFHWKIDVKEKLRLDNWYSLCLTWNGQSKEAHIYVNKSLVESKGLDNQRLGGDGSLVLGQKHMQKDDQLQGNFEMAFVGDMYLFRLWDFEKNQRLISLLDCEDGNVITWDSEHLNFIGVSLESDTTLNCCEQFVKSRFKRSEYEHHRTRISRRLLDLNSTDSFSTTVLSNNTTAAPTTSAITESSTFNAASSPTHTTESSTLNGMSSTGQTTESSTFIDASSPTHTTESSTLNEISSTRHSTGTEVPNMAIRRKNPKGNNSSRTSRDQMNTTDTSTVTALPLNTPESSNTSLTTVHMNTTDTSTVTARPLNTPESSNTSLTTVQMNTTDTSTVTARPLNTPGTNITSMTAVQLNTTDISTVTSLTLITTEDSTVTSLTPNITDISTVTSLTPNTTEDSTVTSLTPNITDISTVTSLTPNTTDISDVTSLTPNITDISTVTSLTQNTTDISDVTSLTPNITDISTVTSLILNTTDISTITSLTPNTTDISKLSSLTPNTTVNSTTGVMSVPMTTTENSTVNVTLIPAVGSTVELVTESPPTTLVNFTDVAAFLSDLDKILQMEAIDAGIASQIIGMISTLLNASPTVLSSFSKRLIQSVDTIGRKLNFTTESINITSSSLALAVSKINATGFNGADFSISDVTNLQVSLDEAAPAETFAAIKLPPSLLSNLTSENHEQASRVQFTFYKKPTLFQDPSLKRTSSLNSYIIASSVANLSIANLTDPVRITFRNIEPTKNDFKVQCVFWDFSKNSGRGGWNSDGCRTKQKASNETSCECDHLTHFGVLLDISRDKIDEQNNRILTFITYIGCGLSSVLLAVTLVTYLAFEKLRRDYPSKILINLCTALLFLNLTFLIDSWISGFSIRGLCIAVAVFLHYFLLVSFTWMSLEAIHMYLALVKVFNTYVRKYMLKFCIIGWGTPSIVIAIVLIISPDNYGLGHYDKTANTTSDMFCWINDDIVFYVAAVAYFCVMFLLNISMFIVVMIQFCRIKNQKQHQNAERSILQNIRSVTGLTFLLGITWGFAFFAWAPVNIPFMYLFAIFNTLQGTFIFIFHCLVKENVQKQWRRYLCCGKLRLAENSDWSKTATNNTKKLQPAVQAKSLSSTFNNSLLYHSSLFLVQEYSSHPNANGAKA